MDKAFDVKTNKSDEWDFKTFIKDLFIFTFKTYWIKRSKKKHANKLEIETTKSHLINITNPNDPENNKINAFGFQNKFYWTLWSNGQGPFEWGQETKTWTGKDYELCCTKCLEVHRCLDRIICKLTTLSTIQVCMIKRSKKQRPKKRNSQMSQDWEVWMVRGLERLCGLKSNRREFICELIGEWGGQIVGGERAISWRWEGK